MDKSMKPGKVLLVLVGATWTGFSAIIRKNIGEGISDYPYSHGLVAEMERSS